MSKTDIDVLMFDYALEKPILWGPLFMNAYMRAGMNIDKYLGLFGTPMEARSQLDRFPTMDAAVTYVEQILTKFTMKVPELLSLVRNLIVMYQFLRYDVLQQMDIDTESIFTAQKCETLYRGFRWLAHTMSGMGEDALERELKKFEPGRDQLSQVHALFSLDVYPKSISIGKLKKIMGNMFSPWGHESMVNPIQGLISMFQEATNATPTHMDLTLFTVPGLKEKATFMCNPYLLSDTPFGKKDIPMQQISKAFLSVHGMDVIGPSKTIAEAMEDNPAVWRQNKEALVQWRKNVLFKLRCGGYLNKDSLGFTETPRQFYSMFAEPFLAVPSNTSTVIPLHTKRDLIDIANMADALRQKARFEAGVSPHEKFTRELFREDTAMTEAGEAPRWRKYTDEGKKLPPPPPPILQPVDIETDLGTAVKDEGVSGTVILVCIAAAAVVLAARRG